MNLQTILREHILEEYLYGESPDNFDDNYDLVEHQVLDSLGMMRLVAYLESQHQIQFFDYDFEPENFSSINALSAFIQRKQATSINIG